MISGNVLRIEKSSIHDGEGLRTVVFLNGCPLSCKWCSTPESQMFHMEAGRKAGLKYLSCRAATIKKGMLRTWMDCVIAFSTVGITFDFIENMVYGMRSGLISALARAVAPGHFIFGVLMGYLYGKFRVSGQKNKTLEIPIDARGE